MAKLHPAVKKFFRKIGRMGGATITEAKSEASRRNGLHSPGRPSASLASQAAAFKEMLAAGYSPQIGPKLHRYIMSKRFKDNALKASAETHKADRTAWTLTKRARRIEGIDDEEDAPKKSKAG